MEWQLIFVSASFVAMLGGIWKIAKDFRNDLDENVKLLFRRFDDHKEAVDKKLIWQQGIYDQKYADEKVCALTRAAFGKTFDEINRKLDMLLEERRVSSH